MLQYAMDRDSSFSFGKSFIKREWVCVEAGPGVGGMVSSTRQLGREERWDPRAESQPCSRKSSLPVSSQGPGRRGDSEEPLLLLRRSGSGSAT